MLSQQIQASIKEKLNCELPESILEALKREEQGKAGCSIDAGAPATAANDKEDEHAAEEDDAEDDN